MGSQKPVWWQFVADDGTFKVADPDRISRLYFPLANEAGLLSSISPDLHGDIKTSHNSFLTLPVSADDLHNIKSSRNFWFYLKDRRLAWSATGMSAWQQAIRPGSAKAEKVLLEAGFLWHKVTRTNAALGLRSEIVNFAPVSRHPVELMMVTLTNISKKPVTITPTCAIPIFARSADNLRDHYHVTSLLQRIVWHRAGVIVKPTMSFDERGHKLNELSYCVLGFGAGGQVPAGVFSTLPDFIGEGGSLETPRAVLNNLPSPRKDTSPYQGKSAIGALRFKDIRLKGSQSARFALIMGITEHEADINKWARRFGGFSKCEKALEANRKFWSAKTRSTEFKTHDKVFDNWIRWVSLQPTLRKLFGCSFLPDFDYGRGGRGWRDLWQDCLALLLSDPSRARPLLLNNFNGVRIDGSNATIIGPGRGEFVADRNNITRVWMDHGVWPFLTLSLYMHQTGDFKILFERARYFRDRQLHRARLKDAAWDSSGGPHLLTRNGRIAEGTVLEHLLVQHLVQFFNVGEHNHIRLENADWNDGLDMAYERGESVAFSAFYGANLRGLADLLEHLRAKQGLSTVRVASELLLLLDRAAGEPVDYASVRRKLLRLERYFKAVQPRISGSKTDLAVSKLIDDLRQKSDFILGHIRKTEWLSTGAGDGFYNGYYDNHGRRVEGDFNRHIRMSLAGQVFPVMAGIATADQIRRICRSVKKHLHDGRHGGLRLNTNFHQIRLDLGRAFSFAYGEKENGAFFSHMVVMYANSLYQRDFVKEAEEALFSIYHMCLNTNQSRIYPGIPEYFNNEGRGMYHYLTGSASWFIMTLLTQVFGVRGFYGDLLLAPKFTGERFQNSRQISANTAFAGRRLKVVYRNTGKIGYDRYVITKASLNGRDLRMREPGGKELLLKRSEFLKKTGSGQNTLVLTLT